MNITTYIAIIITALGTITMPICILVWANRTAVERQLKEKHEENTRNFQALLYAHQAHPPHSHIETTGPLSAEGIYPRRERQ